MKTTSKWKEEREIITCISLSPFKYNLYTRSLSFTLMAKLKLEEERKKQLQLLEIKQQLLFKTLDIPLWRTLGGIYRHQGKGARGTTPGPKHGRDRAHTAAKSPAQPGRRVPALLLRAIPSVPCQLDLLDFGFDLHGLTESPPKVNDYLVGF